MQQTTQRYDTVVIGGGLSGLTAASLLAKRGLRVAVVEKSDQPGGSCGIFRRGETTFDQGSAMLYGFGEAGFNAHRFVMNCLEEPIDVLKHELLYVVNYEVQRVRFFADVDLFAEELSRIFPHTKEADSAVLSRYDEALSAYYGGVAKLYHGGRNRTQGRL